MSLSAAYPPWLLRIAQLFIFIALGYLLWRNVDWGEAWTLLTDARGLPLLAAAALLSVQTLLSALRWRLTASRLGIALPLGQAIREYYLSQVVNQSLPGGVLGDASRAIRARAQAGLLASSQAVIFERIAGQIGLVSVLIAAIAINALNPNGLMWPIGVQIALWMALAITVAGVVFLTVLRRSSVGRGAAQFRHAVLARPVLLNQTALSIGTALCNIAAFALCATAVGATLPPIIAAALIPMILFAMVLPLSIGGWGLREGAAAALFPLAGLTATEGLTASVAFGLTFLVVTLPGLVVVRRRPPLNQRPQPEHQP